MKALCLIAQAHGSNTSGKCSPDKQFYEWKWSREFTNLLVIKLKEELGIHSIIINTEDTEVKLLDQAKRVNEYINEYKKEFDTIFMISPHVNAGPEFKWSKANGFTAFVGTKAGKESKRLASIFGQTAEEMKLEPLYPFSCPENGISSSIYNHYSCLKKESERKRFLFVSDFRCLNILFLQKVIIELLSN